MKRFLLLTANVGSLFEAECKLHEPWLNTVVQLFEKNSPQFAVIHMQETGGKNFVECADQAPQLVEELSRRLPNYPLVRAYLDIEHEVPTFTALGCIIFIREDYVSSVQQFDFSSKQFTPLKNGLQMHLKSLEDNRMVTKRKFPRNFWPAIKWGRKGYMHTRWRIANRVFDFVNVHLFHDESNLALIHENPLLYSANRKRALDFVLEQMKSLDNGCTPLLFIFGDLNFRLDCPSFLNRLTERSAPHALDSLDEPHGSVGDGLETSHHTPHLLHADSLRRTVSAIEFRRESASDISSGCVLRIEKKRFDYFNHKMLLNEWRTYLEDDKETSAFTELNEMPISFPPTYPWSEDPEESDALMKTRAPAWCDRVLMNDAAFSIVNRTESVYTSVGENVCTGDHKPVALSFYLS